MKTRIELAQFRSLWVTLIFSLSLVLVFAASADAATYTVKFCFKYDVDFEDAIAAGGDYWTDNVPKNARGIKARITRNDTGAVVWEDYTGHSDGCTPQMFLSDTRTHTIRLQSLAKLFNDNYVYVYDADDNIITQNVATAFLPTASATYYFTMTSLQDSTNIMAAAGYAIEGHNGGNDGTMIYRIYNHQSEDCEGSCTNSWGIFLSSFGRTRKIIITHEMGHSVANKIFGSTGGGSYDYESVDCDGWDQESGADSHLFDSIEFQNSAASEGFAHFYAAVTWNDTSETDCEFVYYKDVDYSLHNGLVDPNNNYSCANGGQFMQNHCEGDSPYDGLGNEADWMLFWWDVMKTYGSSPSNVFAIWEAAQPGTGDWDEFECNDILRDAAIDLGYASWLWDLAAAIDGVNH